MMNAVGIVVSCLSSYFDASNLFLGAVGLPAGDGQSGC